MLRHSLTSLQLALKFILYLLGGFPLIRISYKLKNFYGRHWQTPPQTRAAEINWK